MLWVDDDVHVIRLARRCAELARWQLDTATTVVSAIDLVEATAYDALVIALILADETGLKLVKHVRRREIQTPMILVSGFVSEAIIAEATAAGADLVLQKPVTPRRLIAEVRRLSSPERDSNVMVSPRSGGAPTPAAAVVLKRLDDCLASGAPLARRTTGILALALADQTLRHAEFASCVHAFQALQICGEESVPFIVEKIRTDFFDRGPDDARVVIAMQHLVRSGTRCHLVAEEHLAEPHGVSPSHFGRLIYNETHFRVGEHSAMVRIRPALAVLAADKTTPFDAAQAAAFDDPSHFSRSVRDLIGITPKGFRRIVGLEAIS